MFHFIDVAGISIYVDPNFQAQLNFGFMLLGNLLAYIIIRFVDTSINSINLGISIEHEPIVNFGAVILGGLLTYFTTRFIEDHKAEINLEDKRRQIFSQLMGRKILTAQLYGSYIEANIFYQFFHILGKEDANDYKRQGSDLALEIARNNQALFEVLGLICILFPSLQGLDRSTSFIIDFSDYFKKRELAPTSGMNESQLAAWLINEKSRLRDDIKAKIEDPIDSLLGLLKIELSKEALS